MSKATTTRRPKLHPHIPQYAQILRVPVEKVLQLIRGKCRDTRLVSMFRAIRRCQANAVPLKQLGLARPQPKPNHEKTRKPRAGTQKSPAVFQR